MTHVYHALLFGGVTALSACAAHIGLTAFHDGVRPFVRDVAAGRMERGPAAKSTWDMSVGFVAYYGIPFTLATGVMEKHILGLPADWIAVRLRRLTQVAVAGMAWGAAASALVSLSQWGFESLPRPMDGQLKQMAVPLLLLLPLVPVVAAVTQFGLVRALPVAVLTSGAYVAADVGSWDRPQAISLAVGATVLVLLAMGERPDEVYPAPDEFTAGAKLVRRGVVPLSLNGAFLAVGTSLFWLAGEPASVMLIGLSHDHWVEAALIGFISWIAFMPLVTLTAITTGAYTTAGMPDGVLALGLLARSPFPAAALGFLGMGSELWALRRFERLLARFPGLHGAGAGIRSGLLQVSELGLLIGGARSANDMWPGIGLYVVGGFWLLNEVSGVRVMRVAVGPLAAIAVGLAFNARVELA